MYEKSRYRLCLPLWAVGLPRRNPMAGRLVLLILIATGHCFAGTRIARSKQTAPMVNASAKTPTVSHLHAGANLTATPGSQIDESARPLEVKNLWPQDITIEFLPPKKMIIPAYQKLWREALRHSETDLRQELISVLEQLHRDGIDQTDFAPEVRALINDDVHPTVKIAAASLLVELNDEASAKLLFRMIKPGRIEFSQIVEPALARWNYQPAISLWNKRLMEKQVRRTHLILAIECLEIVNDTSVVNRLLEIALDPNSQSSFRFPAARAVGKIGHEGLDELAIELAKRKSSNSVINRLCSIALLANQQSEPAIGLLQELMLDDVGAVAGAAWHRVLEIDSELAVPYAKECLSSDDPHVRKSAIDALHQQPSLKRIDLIGGMLSDRHPDVRTRARESLRQLANQSSKFDDRVRAAGMAAVNVSPPNYRGIEQGLILLAALDHQAVASRATELLGHDHPKVFVTAAWTLRMLKLEDTLDQLLVHAEETSEMVFKQTRNEDESISMDHLDQIAHLFDLFGETDFRKSEALMRKFVPKKTELGINARPAAITALGKFHYDDPKSELVPQFVKRMNDQEGDNPDISEVWATCAIALGRMKATSTLNELRQYYGGEPPVDGLNYAAAWSIREMTGEEIPPTVARILKTTGFNLEPSGSRLPIDLGEAQSVED